MIYTRFVCAAALLAACSPNALQPQDDVATRATASWVNAKNLPTVYVSSPGGATVTGFDQKTGEITEQISFNTASPYGLAVDKAGNLYVALASANSIYIFPPGSTKPSLELRYEGKFPWGVSVSQRGEVAVADYDSGSIYFYKKGATTPFNTVSSSSVGSALFDCYDSRGNLYFSASSPSGAPVVAQIVGGGKGNSVTILGITDLLSAEGIEVSSGNQLLVLDSKAQVLYQYPLPNPTTPSGSIALRNADYPYDFALARSEKTFWDVNYDDWTASLYAYPKGGPPKRWIRSGDFPVAVAVSAIGKP